MNIRAKFEEIWPVPEGVYWHETAGDYMTLDGIDDWQDHYFQRARDSYAARLDTFTRCQETMAIPEITNEQVFFALNCHMEDPSDDEEDGFNAGVSWCLAFIKREIAKRTSK